MSQPLGPWEREAKAHRQKYRPKMYKQLEESGQLESSLRNAVDRAKDQTAAMAEAGYHPFEAESESKRQHLFLPAEEDAPELGANPDALPDPASLMRLTS